MTPYEIIKKKRDGGELTREEIFFIIDSFTKGEIPDYQMAAFLMAVYFRKLNDLETALLTQAMQASGKSMDLSSVPGPTVDKHSTGGVGDKVSLPLAPLVAACGGFVPMMSGRGLGHTGGTLDKLESIPGFRVNLSNGEFVSAVREVGCAIIGQTADVAPADKKLYALRDVTATVDSMDLIAASILSKKLAAGPKSLLLDVKTGSGAFMRELDDSRALARLMVAICRNSDRNARALITNMDQPLGEAAGNANEVEESLSVLRGEGPEDLTTLVVESGARMLEMAGLVKNLDQGRARIRNAITSGAGLDRFRKMLERQGGDPRVVDDPTLLPQAAHRWEETADRSGTLLSIDTTAAGMAVVVLGGGRQKSTDDVDHAVGVRFLKKPGDAVEKGEPVFLIDYNDEERLADCRARLEKAIVIGDGEPRRLPLILEEID
ncbi:MAG: thymidine phosphorylase [Candidatus Hydrogenedentota bacterium]|nr:MAG: thymidine phosphorylase [Candidatus Hydrogenedentota bacterium]